MRKTAPMVLCILTAASALTLVPVRSQAQTVASSIGELERLLKRGQTVIVTDSSERTTKGTFFAFVAGSLVLSTPEERVIPWNEISRVSRPDPVWNGALIGGVIAGAWCAVVCGQGLDHRHQLLPVVASNAAVGALVGLGVDALSRQPAIYIKAYGSTAQARVRPSVSFNLRF